MYMIFIKNIFHVNPKLLGVEKKCEFKTNLSWQHFVSLKVGYLSKSNYQKFSKHRFMLPCMHESEHRLECPVESFDKAIRLGVHGTVSFWVYLCPTNDTFLWNNFDQVFFQVGLVVRTIWPILTAWDFMKIYLNRQELLRMQLMRRPDDTAGGYICIHVSSFRLSWLDCSVILISHMFLFLTTSNTITTLTVVTCKQ